MNINFGSQRLGVLVMCLVAFIGTRSQNLAGRVVDAKTNDAVPYATVKPRMMWISK